MLAVASRCLTGAAARGISGMCPQGAGVGYRRASRGRRALEHSTHGNGGPQEAQRRLEEDRVGPGDVTAPYDQPPAPTAKTQRFAPAEDSFRLNTENWLRRITEEKSCQMSHRYSKIEMFTLIWNL